MTYKSSYNKIVYIWRVRGLHDLQGKMLAKPQLQTHWVLT
jgi:hypothetical protein